MSRLRRRVCVESVVPPVLLLLLLLAFSSQSQGREREREERHKAEAGEGGKDEEKGKNSLTMMREGRVVRFVLLPSTYSWGN